MRAISVLMRWAGVAAGLGVGSTVGCLNVRPNPNHCSNLAGDETCAERYPGERAFCAWGTCGPTLDEDGCVATRPEDDACYSPCGGAARFDDDASCLTGVSSSSGEEASGTAEDTTTVIDETSSTGESSTTGPMPCRSDEECTEPEAPFCGVTGECGTCEGTVDPDGACAGVDPGLPLCVGGACVACTPENPLVCDQQLLLCDGDSNACVPCTEHDQCGSGACELAAGAGTCFPSDLVVHVDGDGGQDFMSVAEAVASVGVGGHGVIVVHALDSGLGYPGILVDGDKRIALLAAPGEVPILQGTGGDPGLTVEGAGTILYIEGLGILGNTMGLGLRANDAFVWVDRSRIVQNSGGGVRAENEAELTLRNCFVGADVNDANALEVDGATADVLYTTLAAGTVTAVGLACVTPVSVVVRNSILVSRGNAGTAGLDIMCPEALVTYSATESAVAGEGNAMVGELPTAMPGQWFVDYATGDLHLQNEGLTVFADVAQWSTGDPLTDVDTEPRPNRDGSPDYAGADIPQ